MPEREITILLYRILGSSIGAILAVTFLIPKTRTEALRRLLFSLVCGVLFSPVVHWWLDAGEDIETVAAWSGATALVSWFFMGVITKFDVEAILKLVKK